MPSRPSTVRSTRSISVETPWSVASLVYRAFCRIDCEREPDVKTLIPLAHLVGPDTLKPTLERVVRIARQRGVTRGQRMRVETTVTAGHVMMEIVEDLLLGRVSEEGQKKCR